MVATDPCYKNDLRELLVDYRMPIGCLQNLLQCINDILTNKKFQVKAENVYVTFTNSIIIFSSNLFLNLPVFTSRLLAFKLADNSLGWIKNKESAPKKQQKK